MSNTINNSVGSPVVRDNRTSTVTNEPAARTSSEDTIVNVPNDSVELSIEAKQLAKVKAAIDDTPEVNSERVAELRQKIADGEVEINTQSIALQLIME